MSLSDPLLFSLYILNNVHYLFEVLCSSIVQKTWSKWIWLEHISFSTIFFFVVTTLLFIISIFSLSSVHEKYVFFYVYKQMNWVLLPHEHSSTNADGSNDREKKKHNNAEKWQQI